MEKLKIKKEKERMPFYCLLTAALGVRCSLAFLWLGRVSLVAAHRLLPAAVSQVVELRLSGARASVVMAPRL